MFILLRPSLGPGTLALARAGDTLTINGDAFDFSVIPDGGFIPAEAVASPLITEPVRRIAGRLHIPVMMPIGYEASEAQRFPAPIDNPADGPIELPE